MSTPALSILDSQPLPSANGALRIIDSRPLSGEHVSNKEPGAGTLEFAKSIGSGLVNSPIELAKGVYHSLSGDNSGFKWTKRAISYAPELIRNPL